jgi:hypothetical protein
MTDAMPLAAGRFTAFFDELDDWCGTKPPRRFPPKPGGLRDILLASVIHEAAMRVSDEKIRSQLQDLSMTLQASGVRTLGK